MLQFVKIANLWNNLIVLLNTGHIVISLVGTCRIFSYKFLQTTEIYADF